jgi:uracil permease
MNSLNPVSKTILGVQFLFVAFGAVVLVPLLVGLNPSTALFSAGVGTLIFHLITKGKVPIFLGSSFAFIAPIVKSSELYGMPGTLFGLIGVGLVYFLVSFLIKWRGISFIKRLFPPVVIGPVIILIGLSLAGSGVNMAKDNWLLALISLITAISVSIFGKGLFRLVGIFSGIIVGFIVAVCMGLVDFSTVVAAPWLAWPEFVKPEISWEPLLFINPL